MRLELVIIFSIYLTYFYLSEIDVNYTYLECLYYNSFTSIYNFSYKKH